MHPNEYTEGRKAREAGKPQDLCPYGWETAGYNSDQSLRDMTQCTKRGWWMAGWMDEDMITGRQ